MSSSRHFSERKAPRRIGYPGVSTKGPRTMLSGVDVLHCSTPARSGSPTHSKPWSDIFPCFRLIVPCGSRDGGAACGRGLVRESRHPEPSGLKVVRRFAARTNKVNGPDVSSCNSAKSKNRSGCFHTNRFCNDKDCASAPASARSALGAATIITGTALPSLGSFRICMTQTYSAADSDRESCNRTTVCAAAEVSGASEKLCRCNCARTEASIEAADETSSEEMFSTASVTEVGLMAAATSSASLAAASFHDFGSVDLVCA